MQSTRIKNVQPVQQVSNANVQPENQSPPADGQPFIHFLAQSSQSFLKVMIVLSLVLTILMMASFFFYAFIPVTVLLISYGLLVLAISIERQTAPPEDAQAELAAQTQAVEVEVETEAERRFRRGWRIRSESALRRRLTRVGIEVLIGAALLAAVLGTAVMPRGTIILGIGVLFCYILLLSSPMWLAWLNDVTGDEERRQAQADTMG